MHLQGLQFFKYYLVFMNGFSITKKLICAQQFVWRQVIWTALHETSYSFFGARHAFCHNNDKYVVVSTGPGYVATEITSK